MPSDLLSAGWPAGHARQLPVRPSGPWVMPMWPGVLQTRVRLGGTDAFYCTYPTVSTITRALPPKQCAYVASRAHHTCRELARAWRPRNAAVMAGILEEAELKRPGFSCSTLEPKSLGVLTRTKPSRRSSRRGRADMAPQSS